MHTCFNVKHTKVVCVCVFMCVCVCAHLCMCVESTTHLLLFKFLLIYAYIPKQNDNFKSSQNKKTREHHFTKIYKN